MSDHRKMMGAPEPILSEVERSRFSDLGSHKLHQRSFAAPEKTNGLSTMLRPLPVNCWDWTKAIALPRVPIARRLMPPRGQTWGLGRDALGLSHLTYDTSGTINLHQLDQPPFPCKPKIPPKLAWRQVGNRSGATICTDFPNTGKGLQARSTL